MNNQYYLEYMIASIETLVKHIYAIERHIDKSSIVDLINHCPIFEKNKILKAETWNQAHEKLYQYIEFLDSNRLSYKIEDDFLEKELPAKIQTYNKYISKVIEDIEICGSEYILFFISNLLFDLSRLLIRYASIEVEFEINRLSQLDTGNRKIEIAKIIDGIQFKLTYGEKKTDLVTKKHLVYKRNRLNRIFNPSTDQSLKSISSSLTLLDDIIKATKELQGKRMSIGKNEKDRTTLLASFIQKFVAKDESGYGISETGKSIGEIDIKIENTFGEVISICEGFNLRRSFNKKIISSHIKKLSGYNANGLETLFILVFCELPNYDNAWQKYFGYISTIAIDSYLFLKKQELIGIAPAKMKICNTTYQLHGRIINLYHLFVDMK